MRARAAVLAAILGLYGCADDATAPGTDTRAASDSDSAVADGAPDDTAAPDAAPDTTIDAVELDASDAVADTTDILSDTTAPDTGSPDTTDAADTTLDAGEPLPWEAPPATIELGDEAAGRLVVTTSPLGWALSRGGETLAATTVAAPFAIATSESVSPEVFFDPYDSYFPVEWHDQGVADGYLEEPGGVHRLRVPYGSPQRWASLRVWQESDGRFALRLSVDAAPTDEVFARLVLDAPEDDRYYGLGETFDGVQQRGKRRAMHFVPSSLESANNEAHVPIPFFASTRGFGLFVESRRAGVFDMAHENDDRITVDFAGTDLLAHLIAGEDQWEPLRHYVEMTGKPAVPARWAFGPHLWRNANEDQAEVLADAAAIRANDLAGSVIWIDRPWEQNYNDHVFDPTMFPDPEGMIAELQAMGFRVVVWSSPYLDETWEDMYPIAKENGWFAQVPGGDWFDKYGDLVDLTHPGAIDLWKTLIGNVTSIGVEGFKLDYGEDVQMGLLGVRLPFGFHNGQNEETMHHLFARYYHAPYAEMVAAADGGFILSRTGTYGDQTLTSAVWPGDLDSGFQTFGEAGKYVGGLPSAVSGGLSLSVSGYPFYGSDIGGFRNGRPTKHTMARWIAYGALGTIMQTGGGGKNHNPWDFNEYGGAPQVGSEPAVSQFDEELLAIYREFSRLHTRLFPTIYTYALLARETGRPVTVPFGFAFPETGHHPDHDFVLGDFLLVAPVVDDTFERAVVFPEGRWFQWFTGEVVTGPAALSVPVALAELPLYAREGAIVPLLREDIDTLAPTTDPAIVSHANDPGTLIVRVYPSLTETTFAVYDGTVVTQRFEGDAATMTTKAGTTYASLRLDLEWSARPAGPAVPTTVVVDGQATPLEVDANGRVSIPLDAGEHTIVVQ